MDRGDVAKACRDDILRRVHAAASHVEEDMTLALEEAPWRREWGEHVGAVVHRVRAGRLVSRVPAADQQPADPTPVES